MIRFFKVELSLLVWALIFAGVGFYFMGAPAQAAGNGTSSTTTTTTTAPVAATSGAPGAITSPVEVLSRIHQTDLQEIELGKLAQSKSKSTDVKSFAERMVRDHEANEKEVLGLAKTEHLTLREPMILSPADQTKQNSHKDTAARLKTLSGAAFDVEYTKAMETGHNDAIAMVDSAKTTDPLLQRYLAKLRPILEQHHHLAATAEDKAGAETATK